MYLLKLCGLSTIFEFLSKIPLKIYQIYLRPLRLSMLTTIRISPVWDFLVAIFARFLLNKGRVL